MKALDIKKINKLNLLFMKYEKLNQEMIRYYDEMKPRLMNPTFVSFNVGTSLGTTINRSKSMSTMGMKKSSSDKNFVGQQKNIAANEQTIGKSSLLSTHRRSQSNLFSYGQSSLEPMTKSINGKDIYQKQAKKYNIVTIQPKQYIDTINVFPKLRLENSDQSFFKKLVATNQLVGPKNDSPQKHQLARNAISKKLDLNPEKPQSAKDIPIKPIRGKFLNNLDQLNDIL